MAEELAAPVSCVTVGLLLKKTKKVFSLVQSATQIQYGGGFVIPRSVIKSWCYLK